MSVFYPIFLHVFTAQCLGFLLPSRLSGQLSAIKHRDIVQTHAFATPCRNRARSNIQYAIANMNMMLAAMDADIPSSIGIRRCRILSPNQPKSGDPTAEDERISQQ